MNLHKLLPLFVCLSITYGLTAQCPPGQTEVRIEINTDEYWYEVHWTFKNEETGAIYETGGVPDSETHEYNYCIPAGCTIFQIKDDYGDGMAPDGYYRLFVNNTLVRENIGGAYGAGESVKFGCPPGTTCESALPVDIGAWASPDGAQVWYRFVPADNGIYQINTCDTLNACGSKIWVYSQCEDILISDDPTGADFYAEGGCDNGAAASLVLAGGQDYFIRIRYEPANCDTTPIHFTLSYTGPVIGCMDPNACNFEPLATISGDTCIYPGDPACPTAPDLVTREDVFRQSLEFSTINNPDACAVEEGCIRGLGIRHIIEFTTFIENIGDQDYHIGTPPTDINTISNQFVWDPCHQHWHYLGYADYILFDANGLRIPIGSKTGFCVLDLICPPEESKYNCVNMGITAGCADVYDKGLPCQWIDITDIPAGDYTLVMRVNWDRSPDGAGRIESNYNNNWAQACFTLSYDGGNPDVVFHNDQCAPFADCAGEVFGNAQPDCNGVCNGPALHGDLNQDTIRNVDDTQEYLAAANANNGDASSCLDLDDNGSINVYDAALLQECYIHQDEPQYWIQAFPCEFPTGFSNTQDLVSIEPGTVDTVAKTFDIKMANPFNKIMGYEFSVSGLVISSIENLAAGYNADLRFNAATGEIVALGLDESAVNKNPMPAEFLRIHYAALTGTEVCIESITAVVNSKYQLSNVTLASPNCVSVMTSGIGSVSNAPFGVYVQPNPFVDKTTIFFENEAAEAMQVDLTDITGKTVRSFDGIRGTSVTFERNNLPSGTYFFTVRNNKGSVSGKLFAQ